jgi:predicted enzyme related to lactoylglutathione lyase
MAAAFGHLEIFVEDPAKLKSFYTDALGFEVVADQGRNIWFRSGSTEILLRGGAKKREAPAMPFDIVLYTDDLEGEAERLRKTGAELSCRVGEPDCYYFQDPEGNWFQLVDPREHV